MPPKEELSSGVLIDHPAMSEEVPSQPPISKPSHSLLHQDHGSVKASFSAPFNSHKKEELWWIHGNGYDLNQFVARHPGGLEAILLGKGRDCTALVESYHAFSSQHSKVLEKYLVQKVTKNSSVSNGQDKATLSSSTTIGSSDFFYDVLKERAADALRAKGIDPVNDRGAGWWRTLYYIVIVALVFVTGDYHAKVRKSLWVAQSRPFSFRCFVWIVRQR